VLVRRRLPDDRTAPRAAPAHVLEPLAGAA
jgi:hypothetical protein